eukprot:5390057-Prorocentrum_lima.AAC.1
MGGVQYALKVIRKAPPIEYCSGRLFRVLVGLPGNTWTWPTTDEETIRRPLDVYENFGGPIEHFGVTGRFWPN